MSDEGPSTSHAEPVEEQDRRPPPLFITHKVSRLDTLAGLAIKYNVAVADIKRANSLLSDSAMFAKDTVLIPTQKMTCGVQYSTWAGMIVAQYGRIPGDRSKLAAAALSFASDDAPRQSAALDRLQQYYGTGDTSSEPPDFRPGDPDGFEGSASGTEIELSDLDRLGRLRDTYNARDTTEGGPESVEYAGSKSGNLADDRVRRRRAFEAASSSAPGGREAEESGHILLNAPDAVAGGGIERAMHHTRSTSGDTMGRFQRSQIPGPPPPQRRESILERLKRVASQPALASMLPPSTPRLAEVFAAPAENLPPLPPGKRERSSTGSAKGKEVKKLE